MTRRARGCLLGLAVAALGALALAQSAPEVRIRTAPWFPGGLVISSDVNVVELAATVRDRNGRPVSGLKATDFEIFDDNHPREITFFSEQRVQTSAAAPVAAAGISAPAVAPASPAPAPRSIALFFDDAHATMMGLRQSAQAAGQLVASGLLAGDRIGIFTASGTVGVDFTSDWKSVPPALARLRPHPPNSGYVSDSCPRLTTYQAYVIANHLDMMAKQVADAEAIACRCPDPTPECVRAAQQYVQDISNTTWEIAKSESINSLDVLGIVIRHAAAAPQKRILVLMSPGLLTGGLEEHTSALVDIALRAGITIAAVNSEGLTAPTGEPGGHARWEDRSIGQRESVLSQFPADAAHATGGQYIHNTNDLAGGLAAVTAVPEVSYVLGFAASGKPDGKYHLLKTRLRSLSGCHVEARAGYFSAGLTRATESAQQRIDRIAMSGAGQQDFSASLRLAQGPAQDNRPTVSVTISVDAAGLKFPTKEGRHVQELTFLTVLEDAQGNFVSGKQSVMDMAFQPASLARYRKQGIQAATSFSVPPGSYRVREVVREATQDRISTSSAAIDVR